MTFPRVPQIITGMEEPPKTPLMQQHTRWHSRTPDSSPELSSTPNSPETPVSPLSPATPQLDQWASLDNQITLNKTSSPKFALHSRIPSRQPSLKRQPKKIGQLILGRQIGSGSFSRTFEAHGRQIYAVKTRLPSTSTELFKHEQAVLQKLISATSNGLSPVGVVQYFPDLSEPEHSVFKLYEANLEVMVQSQKFRSRLDFFDYSEFSQPLVGFERWVRWSEELIKGLQFIHSQGIIHADIKPDNVLVTSDSVVISDFSGAIDIFQGSESPLAKELSNGIAGSATYTDPEILYQSKKPSFGSDIYALGLVLAFCATGTEPYGAAKNTVQRLTWMEKVGPLESFDSEVQVRLTHIRPLIEKCLTRTLDGVPGLLEDLYLQATSVS